MIRKLLPAAAAMLIFACLAAMVTADRTQQFDESIRMAVHSWANPALTSVMRNISLVGEPAVLIDAGGALLVILLIMRKWHAAVLIFLVVGGAEMVDQILKLAFHRPRPHVFFGLHQPLGYSFPSGHSLVSCAIFGALAIFVASRARSRTRRWLFYSLAALPALAIGLSRVYLGMHYPTDVLGGYAAAAFWLSIVYLLWQRRDSNRTFGSRSH